MPEYVTENIFLFLDVCTVFLAPVVLKTQDKGRKRGETLSYTELLLIMRRQPVLHRIYLPRSEPDRNAAATQHVSAADASLKDGQVSGKRQQQQFPTTQPGSKPCCGRRESCLPLS